MSNELLSLTSHCCSAIRHDKCSEPKFAHSRNQPQRRKWLDWFLESSRNRGAAFSYSYMLCPLTHIEKVFETSRKDFQESSGYSKTESVMKKRRIRSWWPSANRPTPFLAKKLVLEG